jgi:predicted AAA+ superfamily ATPase
VEKFFNTAGPVQDDINYMVDPLRRIDYENILQLIRTRRYFVLHAPRQTGKTTSLLAMVKRLNDDGEFACVYVKLRYDKPGKETEPHNSFKSYIPFLE